MLMYRFPSRRRHSFATHHSDDVDEFPEYDYDEQGLNLGAETPLTPGTPSTDAVRKAVYEWASLTPGLNMNGPLRSRTGKAKAFTLDPEEEQDLDCGIW